MKMGTVIRVEYSLDSLAGVSATAYEAELHDALRQRWPGAYINIAQTGNNKYWGVIGDTTEIDSDEIRRISEAVFDSLCHKGVASCEE